MVRHAMSVFNYQSMKIKQKYGETSEELFKLRASRDNIDTVQHPIGEMQCLANREAVHCLNAKYVLVSPMRRALQTSILMFKDHP